MNDLHESTYVSLRFYPFLLRFYKPSVNALDIFGSQISFKNSQS